MRDAKNRWHTFLSLKMAIHPEFENLPTLVPCIHAAMVLLTIPQAVGPRPFWQNLQKPLLLLQFKVCWKEWKNLHIRGRLLTYWSSTDIIIEVKVLWLHTVGIILGIIKSAF